jgi:hypothetical protein
MSLVGLLVFIIVLGLVFWLVQMLLAQLPMPQPFKTAALCVLILIAIIVLLDWSGILGGVNLGRLR